MMFCTMVFVYAYAYIYIVKTYFDRNSIVIHLRCYQIYLNGTFLRNIQV